MSRDLARDRIVMLPFLAQRHAQSTWQRTLVFRLFSFAHCGLAASAKSQTTDIISPGLLPLQQLARWALAPAQYRMLSLRRSECRRRLEERRRLTTNERALAWSSTRSSVRGLACLGVNTRRCVSSSGVTIEHARSRKPCVRFTTDPPPVHKRRLRARRSMGARRNIHLQQSSCWQSWMR